MHTVSPKRRPTRRRTTPPPSRWSVVPEVAKAIAAIGTMIITLIRLL
jgi:hypothetical protein